MNTAILVPLQSNANIFGRPLDLRGDQQRLVVDVQMKLLIVEDHLADNEWKYLLANAIRR
jgi:hypothetical protein